MAAMPRPGNKGPGPAERPAAAGRTHPRTRTCRGTTPQTSGRNWWQIHDYAAPPSPRCLHRRAHRERDPVHPGTVKRIQKGPGVAHQDKTVPGKRGAEVGKTFAPMHVALAPLRLGENLARDGVLHQETLQPLTQRTAFRPLHPPLVEHHPDAHVPALERNAPGPPAVAGEMA